MNTLKKIFLNSLFNFKLCKTKKFLNDILLNIKYINIKVRKKKSSFLLFLLILFF